jgi:hypothetical protein
VMLAVSIRRRPHLYSRACWCLPTTEHFDEGAVVLHKDVEVMPDLREHHMAVFSEQIPLGRDGGYVEPPAVIGDGDG